MRSRLSATMIFVITFLLPIFGLVNLQAIKASAQEDHPRFLISPYYGSLGQSGLHSWFDHKFPGNTEPGYADGKIVTFFGDERISPTNCTSGWNGNCYDGHNGIDFDLNYTQVLAAADGNVIFSGYNDDSHHNFGLGLYVALGHNVNGIQYITRYGHLTSTAVNNGQAVKAGTIIGTSGSNGASTGPHLHFEISVYKNGMWRVIDPFGWQPEPGADVQIDPWAQTQSGAESWCMWIDGEWANQCEGHWSRPLPAPITNGETIVDDTTNNSAGFSKGNNGLWANPCTGIDPGCREWYEASVGTGGHTYRTIANGNTLIDNWAKWQPVALQIYANFSDLYEAFVWVPTIPGLANNTFTWRSPFKFSRSGSNKTSLVDEYIGDGENYNPRDKWLSIGSDYLTPNTDNIYTIDATGELNYTHCQYEPSSWCRMTADAVKFVRLGTNYLPDVRRTEDNGWSTNIIARNTGGGWTRGKISSFSNGQYCRGAWATINYQGTSIHSPGCDISPLNSAIASFEGDTTVVTVQYASGKSIADNSLIPGNRGDLTFERIGSTIFIPALYKNVFGGYTSKIFIMNAGTSTATTAITFRKRSTCSPNCDDNVTISRSIPVNKREEIDLANILNSSSWVGSAVVTCNGCNQTLAVRIYDSKGGLSIRSYNGSAGGGTTLYVPAAYRNNWNMTTGLVIQNLHSTATATVEVKFYDRTTGIEVPGATRMLSIQSRRAAGLWLGDIPELNPNGWTGTIRIRSVPPGGGNPTPSLAAVVNTINASINPDGEYEYNAVATSGKFIYFPYASRNSSGRTTGYTLMNPSNTSAVHIKAYYINSGGSVIVNGFQLVDLAPHGAWGYYQSNPQRPDGDLPDGWVGSIMLVADGPIIAIIREDSSSTTSAYNGLAR